MEVDMSKFRELMTGYFNAPGRLYSHTPDGHVFEVKCNDIAAGGNVQNGHQHAYRIHIPRLYGFDAGSIRINAPVGQPGLANFPLDGNARWFVSAVGRGTVEVLIDHVKSSYDDHLAMVFTINNGAIEDIQIGFISGEAFPFAQMVFTGIGVAITAFFPVTGPTVVPYLTAMGEAIDSRIARNAESGTKLLSAVGVKCGDALFGSLIR